MDSGYDLIDSKTGETYQVKARRIFKSHQYKISLSKYKKYKFDYLIVILFDECFFVRDAYKFPYKAIPKFFEPEKENMKLELSLDGRPNRALYYAFDENTASFIKSPTPCLFQGIRLDTNVNMYGKAMELADYFQQIFSKGGVGGVTIP